MLPNGKKPFYPDICRQEHTHSIIIISVTSTVQDWKLSVDLATTALRPDILLVSGATKKIVLLERTVPWEDHLD